MSCFAIINFIIVFVFGVVWGFLELLINYDLRYIGVSRSKRKDKPVEDDKSLVDKEENAIWYVIWYLLLNGFISVVALLLLKYCAKDSLKDVSCIELKNLIIAGFSGIIILRSSFISIQVDDKGEGIGLMSVVQALLDKIEKKIKHNIAAKRICEIYKIMKEVNYEYAKKELPYLCISFIDNFSEKDSKNLINAIKDINDDLSNVNKSLQLGREIANYCDVEILKRAVKKLPILTEEDSKYKSDAKPMDEFESRKEKLLKNGNGEKTI